MTLTSTDTFTAHPSTASRGAAFWARLGVALETYARKRSRLGEIERLQALTDTELAARGLTRDRIVLHVFRDMAAV